MRSAERQRPAAFAAETAEHAERPWLTAKTPRLALAAAPARRSSLRGWHAQACPPGRAHRLLGMLVRTGGKHAHSLPAWAGEQRVAAATRLWACHPRNRRRAAVTILALTPSTARHNVVEAPPQAGGPHPASLLEKGAEMGKRP
jgi:hypothetical protein